MNACARVAALAASGVGLVVVLGLFPQHCAGQAEQKPAPQPEASSPMNAKAVEVLRQAAEHLRRLKALTDELRLTINVQMQGIKQEMGTDYSLAIQRPNQFALVLKNGMMGTTVVSDGKKRYTFMPLLKRYTESEAPADLSGLAQPEAGTGLLAGSPATDAGKPALCAATDQRGVPQPVGAACDIGAFEARQSTLTECDPAQLAAAVQRGGLVTMACDGTFVLSNTLIVRTNVTLDATGHEVTISGSNATRLFWVSSGVTLTLRGLTLADGLAQGTNGNPGVSGGPGEGGAIYNNGGVVVAEDCTFRRHTAQGGNGGEQQFAASAAGGPARGGAIYSGNAGQIVASNCQFIANRALGGTAGMGVGLGPGGDAAGGAIYATGGAVQLTHCLVVSNNAVSGQGRRHGGLYLSGVAYGGAIYSLGGTVVLSQVVGSNNTCAADYLAAANGGVAYQDGGTLALAASHLTANQALAGRGLRISTPSGLAGGNARGGAVCVVVGQARIHGSTLDHNLAVGGAEPGGGSRAGSGLGGAIYCAGTLAMTNSTLAANQALSGHARPSLPLHGQAKGGALCIEGGVAQLVHVTVGGNSAALSGDGSVGYFLGGGIASANGSVTLRNTLLAHGPSGSNWYGAGLVDAGNNLSSDASCPFTAPGSLSNTDPLLAPLDDFSGPTPTMALLAGSPALDAGLAAWCPATDQRGVARPFGAACDIGAFESAPPYSIRGFLGGYLASPGGSTVTCPPRTSPADPASGRYVLWDLVAGNHLVTPHASQAVFEPRDRLVALTADAVAVNFYA